MSNQRFFTVEGSSRTYDRNKLLTVLLFAFALALLQVSAVNNLLPSIETGLGANDADLQWVLSGYALAFGVILIPVGRFGDIFGRSGGFTTGIALFALTSLGCGLAPTPLMLNIMRALQGFSAGVFGPQVTALIQEYFEGKERARAFGIMGLVISASVAAGPILSGLFVALLGPESGWRWNFLINLPLGLILVVLCAFWLPFGKERRTMGRSARAARKAAEAAGEVAPREKIDLDPLGNVLVSLAVLCLMLPFMTHFAWRWILLAAAAVLIVAWIFWERAYKARGRYPMVDLSLFKIPTYTFCTSVTALQFLGTTSIFVIVALFLQQGMGLSALATGLVGLPNALAAAVFSLWSGSHSFERGAQIQVLALVLVLTGVLTSIPVGYAVASGASPMLLAATLTLAGIGMGMIGSANQTQAMLQISPSHAGTAGGVQQTAQRITTAIGNAMITAVFFAGRGNAATHAEWMHGLAVGLVVIAVPIIVALTVAIIFMKKYPHAGPDFAGAHS